ncbi:MAG: flagellar hook-length control protein FliK [Oscillospiraceae bacterium]|jgi:flagellar hook-length control protein FliK|nr:flagellar hook-length control protein FliK [Oscillospiraceae bacterium]
MMVSINITPQGIPQAPQCAGFGEISEAYGEEGFGECVKLAITELGRQETGCAPKMFYEKGTVTEAPEFIPKPKQKQDCGEEEQILASCLLSMAIPAVIDEKPKIAELETVVKPQAHTAPPELPEMSAERDVNSAPQPPGNTEIPGQAGPETPEPVKSETAQVSETPEIAGAKAPEPATPEPVKSETAQVTAEETLRFADSSEPKVFAAESGEAIAENPEAVHPQGYVQPETYKASETAQILTAEFHGTAKQTQLPKAEAQHVRSGIIYSEKPAETAEIPKHTVTQIPQEAKEFLEKFGEVKFAAENGKSAEITAEPVKPEETLKVWETIQKAHVEIKEKPEELNELLEKFKAQNHGKTEKLEKTEKPAEMPKTQETAKTSETTKIHDIPKTPETLQISATTHFEPKSVIPEKADLPQLPKSTITQVSEQILAKMATAKNGTTAFEMILNPAELGKISVKIVVQATGTAVEITAEKAATAQLLQNSADKIGFALERSDAKLESFVVNVETKQDYSEQRENRNDNRGEQQQQDSDEAGEEEQGISFAELLQAG